jgi:hypothetical protein
MDSEDESAITCEAGHPHGKLVQKAPGGPIRADEVWLSGKSDGRRSTHEFRCECGQLVARLNGETGSWQVHTSEGWTG